MSADPANVPFVVFRFLNKGTGEALDFPICPVSFTKGDADVQELSQSYWDVFFLHRTFEQPLYKGEAIKDFFMRDWTNILKPEHMTAHTLYVVEQLICRQMGWHLCILCFMHTNPASVKES